MTATPERCCDRYGIGDHDSAEHSQTQEQIDAEWREARSPYSSIFHGRCPDCAHRITDHTARVGEGIRICSSCPCDRYAHYS